jgi:hypothetical protein
LTTEPDDAAYNLGKTIAGGGADPGLSKNPLDPANVTEIDVGGIVSEAAGQRSLTPSCIQSPSFTMLGKSYTLDTSQLCQFATVVGYMMVAAASIIAVRMITA